MKEKLPSRPEKKESSRWLSCREVKKNLLIAFAGESQARNRYSYYAKVAKKEGYVQISGIFERTAEQERAHAKTLLKFLEEGEVEITVAYPTTPLAAPLIICKTHACSNERKSLILCDPGKEMPGLQPFPCLF